MANNTTERKCSFHHRHHRPSEGHTTAEVRREYCEQNPSDHAACARPPVDGTDLIASLDPNDPLRFWQLYSLIGEEPIKEIVTNFYERIFADDQNPCFRDAFTKMAPLEHHISAQTSFWVDAMGGGRRYLGGTYRLNFHHRHHAEGIMNADGARRWMYHMRNAIGSVRFEDPRVKPCIMDFLRTKMKRYAMDFGWEYDEGDMVLHQD